jgi:hypothetical protein
LLVGEELTRMQLMHAATDELHHLLLDPTQQSGYIRMSDCPAFVKAKFGHQIFRI